MVKSKTASASARPTETAQRKTVLVAKCLTAFLAALLLSGWSIWSEEKDPEKLLDEMADQSAKLYKRCTGLAVDAELALREFPKERQEIIDRWREENITPKPKGGGYAALGPHLPEAFRALRQSKREYCLDLRGEKTASSCQKSSLPERHWP